MLLPIWQAAEGWYYEPTFASSRCATASEVTWAGLGGYHDPYNSGYLAQNGTAWNSSGVDNHQAWWEIVPKNSLTVIDYYATPGVIMDVSTRNIGNGFRFWFYNYAGQSKAFNVTQFGSFPLAQSAAVVIERPTVMVNGVTTVTNLANFQSLTVNESAAASQGNSEVTFDQFPPNLDTTTGLWRHGAHMISDTTGRDLADPGDILGGGSFLVKQHNCN